MDYIGRIKKLRAAMRGLDAFAVTEISNVHYLTGFTGSSGMVVVAKKDAFFVTDFRYQEQSLQEVAPSGCEVVIEPASFLHALRRICRKLGIMKLGLESSVSHGLYVRVNRFVPEVRALSDTVRRIRQVKEAQELRAIKKAVRRAEEAFLEVRPYLKAGVRERSVAMRLEERLRKKGSRRLPFSTIVASGENAALPHAGVTERKLQAGDLVTIDWGAEADGYFSDMTRTFILKGKDISRQKEIYGLVLAANKQGIAAVGAGMKASDIDLAARDVIKNAGYGECFGHGTGHGVGIEVHELPRVSRLSKTRLKEGMVFTVEPGIYVPGLGGVRIEDMVSVANSGCTVLTSLPKRLEIL